MYRQLFKKKTKPLLYTLLLITLISFGTYLGTVNMLLFHTLAELFSIFIAIGILFIAINAYKVKSDQHVILLGIGYGFVVIFDLLHTLTFKGIGIFPHADTNMCTQLWLVARYYEAITIVIMVYLFFYKRRKVPLRVITCIYTIFSILTLVSIFRWNSFPTLFIPGSGTTMFKEVSEIIIIGILVLITYLVTKNKQCLSNKEYFYLLPALITTIAAEVLLMSFHDVYNIPFTLGHICKVLSFYFLYKAFIDTSLQKPYIHLEKLNVSLEEKTIGLQQINTWLQEEIIHREALEGQLLEKEEILNAILNSFEHGICVTDENEKFIYKNNNFKELWNIPAELHQEIDAHKMATYLNTQILNTEELLPKLHEITEKYEHRIDFLYFKNGKILERAFYPLNTKQNSRGSVWFFRDVTEKTKIEETIRKGRERFKKLLEVLPDAILLHHHHEITYANSAAAQLLDVAGPDELLGRNLFDFIHESDYPIILDTINQKLKGKPIEISTEQKLVTATGKETFIETTSATYEEDNKQMILAVWRDISKRKEAEELQRRLKEEENLRKESEDLNRLRTEFFSNISHELKTPLNIILGTIQLLSATNNTSDHLTLNSNGALAKHVKVMQQNCYRLLRLMNNLIDITRLDANFFNLQLINSNIVAVVEDISLSISSYAKTRGVNLVFDTEVEEVITAFDPEQMERIMLNLLSNALKFTPPDGEIHINIAKREDTILLSVKDTGIGIPEEKLQDIFVRFKQVEPLLSRKTEGSGIGLSLVKALVEIHEGKIDVRSKIGKGTEFTIQFPIQLVEEDDIAYDEVATTTSNIEKIKVEFSDIYSNQRASK